MSDVVVDIGLRLPNGKEVWGEYKGFTLETPQDRLKLAEALAQTEADLSMPQGAFLRQHVWVKRESKPLGEFSIDDPSIISDVDDE
jgi:hypothetical protein